LPGGTEENTKSGELPCQTPHDPKSTALEECIRDKKLADELAIVNEWSE
jgi:hypothetical protein